MAVGLLQVGAALRGDFIYLFSTFPPGRREGGDSGDLRFVVSVSAYLQGLRVKGEGSSSHQFPWTH